MHTSDNPSLISDDLLTQLARPSYLQICGQFDPETRAILAIALPDLCNELLYLRQKEVAQSFGSKTAQAFTQLDQARFAAYATLVEARGGVFRSENIPQMMPAEVKPDPERSELARAIERAQPAIRAAAARVRGFGGDAA